MKKRIVLIGPVYPYKGGISHYTALMCRTLAKENDVFMVSFKLQYPRFLFKKEQKDYDNDGFRIADTRYWINTANPCNWAAAAGKIKELRPDMIICQWWHPYFAPCYYTLARLLRRYRWLFVCHNVFPHERFPLDRVLTRMVLRQGNCFIVQSGQDAGDLCTVVEKPVYAQTVHPTYNAFKFAGLSRQEARDKLKLDSDRRVMLFFGFVREYKGLKHLIAALPIIKEKLERVTLLVVGDFGADKERYLKLIEEKNAGDVIEIHDGYIPDHEVEKFFAACDVVVLPYESATQSGIVQIAYGFERPVIVTDVGGLPDVVTDGKTGYVVEPGRADKLAEAVIRFFGEGKAEEFSRNVSKEAYRFSWDRMAERIEELMDMED